MSGLFLDKAKIISNIDIIFVRPRIPENIGLAARTLKNTGFKRLKLVQPKLTAKAFETAKRARDLLEESPVYESLSGAGENCGFLFGTTRRRREYVQVYEFRAVLPRIIEIAVKNRVGIVFGREDFGLSREELAQCHGAFSLPSYSGFPSYNLAVSAGIVCYEIFNYPGGILPAKILDFAKRKDVDALNLLIKERLSRSFGLKKGEVLTKFLERLFTRAMLTQKEIKVLWEVFSKITNDEGGTG